MPHEQHRDQSVGVLSPSIPISVVIPVHNGQRDIAACIRSLQASRGVTLQIIVVDDGSTDDTSRLAFSCGVTNLLRSDRCQGPAAARNAGVEVATCDCVFFVDADVLVHTGTLLAGAICLTQGPWDAVFGSYDAVPSASGIVSQFRNLLHHFVHQTSHAEASTFWSGCGAVNRGKFREIGGFSTDFQVPCVEDIEFGMRFCSSGFRIRLQKEMLATHTKHWSLWNMIFTDIFRRGIPWTRLVLARGRFPNDLNTSTSKRLCVAMTGMAEIMAAGLPLSGGYSLAVAIALAVTLITIFLLEHRLIVFFIERRGLLFATCCLPLVLIYHTCCGIAFVAGYGIHLWARLSPKRFLQPTAPVAAPGWRSPFLSLTDPAYAAETSDLPSN